MPKTFVIMRHGETQKDDLNTHGINQCKQVARFLSNKDFIPEQIVHTGLPRTRQSAETIASAFKSAGHEINRIDIGQNLQQELLVEEIMDLDESTRVVLMVAHIEDVRKAEEIFGSSYQTDHIPNGYTLVVQYEEATTWAEVAQPKRELIKVTPYIPG